MSLSIPARISIRRQFNAGVPHMEIAEAFGVSVAQVLLIANHRDAAGRVRRKAEPLPGLRDRDWKQARPAEDRIGRGEACRFPDCVSKVCRGSYCAEHGRLIYRPRVTAA